MMGLSIRVNGEEISTAMIAAEMQNHPAASAAEAWQQAAKALAIRALLLQEAERLQVAASAEPDESVEEARIRALLAATIDVDTADEKGCQEWYDAHRKRYRGRDVYEVAHILLPADPKDADARNTARAEAERLIGVLTGNPAAFADLARAHSACASAQNGGQLGQMSRGDLVDEVETFVMALAPGQLCPVPVMSRFGAHVLRLDRREEALDMPFPVARPMVERDLHGWLWQRAVSDYLHQLAARARLEGIELETRS